MATHFSIFAWRIPWTEELGGLQSMGSQRVGHYWKQLSTCMLVLKLKKQSIAGIIFNFGTSLNIDDCILCQSCFRTSGIKTSHGGSGGFNQLQAEFSWCVTVKIWFIFWCKEVLILHPCWSYTFLLLSHVWLCNRMDFSMPGFPVLHYFLELAQTHVHWVDDGDAF